MDKFSTPTQRMDDLDELQFCEKIVAGQGVLVAWPPKGSPCECDSDAELECGCQGKRQQPGRGTWGDGEFEFHVKVVTPKEVRQRRSEMLDVDQCPQSWEVELTNGLERTHCW